jgi:hypothetical protein
MPVSDFDREMTRLEGEIKRLEVEYNMFFAGRRPRLPWETRARVEQLVKHYDRMNLSNTAQRFRFSTVQSRFVTFCELWERNLRAKEEGRGPRPTLAVAPVAEAPSSPPPPLDAAGRESGAEPASPILETAPTTDRDETQPATPAAVNVAAPPVREVAAERVQPTAPIERSRPGAIQLPSSFAPARAAMDSTRIGDFSRDSDRVSALYDELTRARREAGEAPMPFDRFATVIKAQVAKLGGGEDVAFRVSVNQGKVTLMAKKAE